MNRRIQDAFAGAGLIHPLYQNVFFGQMFSLADRYFNAAFAAWLASELEPLAADLEARLLELQPDIESAEASLTVATGEAGEAESLYERSLATITAAGGSRGEVVQVLEHKIEISSQAQAARGRLDSLKQHSGQLSRRLQALRQIQQELRAITAPGPEELRSIILNARLL